MLDDDTRRDAFQARNFTRRCEITPVERRVNVARLDTFVINLPVQVRPVIPALARWANITASAV